MSSAPISQDERLFYLDTPLGKDELILKAFRGTEGISQLYRYELEVVSVKPALPVHQLIGQFVKFAVRRSDAKKFRYLGGYVSEVSTQPPEGRLFAYKLTLVPWLWFLTKTLDCRIEQNKSVPDIIKAMFDRYGYNDYRFDIYNTYGQWEYSAQYRESSFNYFSRLLELEGLFYFFEQKEDRTVLVIGDSPATHPYDPVQSRFEMEKSYGTGYRRLEDTIQTWVVDREFQPGKYTHRDYNFETPSQNLQVEIPSTVRLGNNDKFEVYDYPGEYEDTSDGDAWARRRMEKTETEDTKISGSSNGRALAAGYKFDLVRHDRRDQNVSYVTTSITHEGEEVNILPQQDVRLSHYKNTFTCMPHSKPFRSQMKTPKHLVKGPQTAVVVGPSGEEIYPDKYGRVKVQFHWDREGKKNEGSSCWIRVSHPWASSGYGAMFLPRIGDEVIVDFLEGDPDRPIITGRVYNANNMPPYSLPSRMNWSGIKSRSTKGGGGDNANELRFEDTKGDELFLMHAEKNMELTVENDIEIEVGNDHSFHVKNDSVEKVGANEDRKIASNQTVAIGGNQEVKVGGDQVINTTGTITISGMDIKLVAQKSIVLQAGVSVTVASSSGFVDVGAANVAIQGPMVLINGGGAKSGSASAKSPKTPKAPKEPKRFKNQ